MLHTSSILCRYQVVSPENVHKITESYPGVANLALSEANAISQLATSRDPLTPE